MKFFFCELFLTCIFLYFLLILILYYMVYIFQFSILFVHELYLNGGPMICNDQKYYSIHKYECCEDLGVCMKPLFCCINSTLCCSQIN